MKQYRKVAGKEDKRWPKRIDGRASGQMPPALFFYPKIFIFGYWVEEGQIKIIGVGVGENLAEAIHTLTQWWGFHGQGILRNMPPVA